MSHHDQRSLYQDPRNAPHDRAHRTPGGPVAKGREGGLFRADYIRAAVCVRARAGAEGGVQETRGRSHVLNNVPTKIPDQFCAEIHILLRLEHDHCIGMSTAYVWSAELQEDVQEDVTGRGQGRVRLAARRVASFVALPPARDGYRITSSPTLSPTMTNAMVSAQRCRDLLQ
jgi:hypothetical protein